MDWKLELVVVPVSDVDRAKAFYTEQLGFNADHDHVLSDELRFVQLTPPGSGCSIALGKGLTDTTRGRSKACNLSSTTSRSLTISSATAASP
jgi:catechol 2,3-dioxygenase-like lactoylglutathione lyase family enzyme